MLIFFFLSQTKQPMKLANLSHRDKIKLLELNRLKLIYLMSIHIYSNKTKICANFVYLTANND